MIKNKNKKSSEQLEQIHFAKAIILHEVGHLKNATTELKALIEKYEKQENDSRCFELIRTLEAQFLQLLESMLSFGITSGKDMDDVREFLAEALSSELARMSLAKKCFENGDFSLPDKIINANCVGIH